MLDTSRGCAYNEGGIKISRTVLIRGLQSSSCNKKQKYVETIYRTVKESLIIKDAGRCIACAEFC